MLKILKKLGKEIWKADKEVEKKLPKKKRKKKAVDKKELTEQFFKTINSEIEKNGSRTIKVSTIMKKLGIGKRSDSSTLKFLNELKTQGLYTLPIFSKDLPLNSLVKIYSFPVKQLGELFEKEKYLEEYIETNELYKQLKIEKVIRQFSPEKSRDKLDFKGINDNELIVLELKNKGGGKSAIEQVQRYAQLLKMQFPDTIIRKVLVTGIQNYETALVFKGMKEDEKENFEWYLYKYFPENNIFEFVRINENDLEF